MKILLSFNGSQETKDKYVNRLKEHRRLEHLIQGIGWESNGTTKGCAVGCTLENYAHKQYEAELGIPEWLARLEDFLFEQLPKEDAEDFAIKFLEVIPIGKNLEPIRHLLGIAIQEKNIENISLNKKTYADQCRSAINLVIAWHRSKLINPADSAADSAARSAAGLAARSAAESARLAARSARLAESAAWSAAESAAESAWSAVWSATVWSAADSAARSAFIKWETNLLLKLLSEA